jgi:hypothetical protein
MIDWIKNILFGGCFHDWGKWEDCDLNITGDYNYTVSAQRRWCKKCHKKKVKRA